MKFENSLMFLSFPLIQDPSLKVMQEFLWIIIQKSWLTLIINLSMLC